MKVCYDIPSCRVAELALHRAKSWFRMGRSVLGITCKGPCAPLVLSTYTLKNIKYKDTTDRVPQCSLGRPLMPDPPASVSPALESQACAGCHFQVLTASCELFICSGLGHPCSYTVMERGPHFLFITLWGVVAVSCQGAVGGEGEVLIGQTQCPASPL